MMVGRGQDGIASLADDKKGKKQVNLGETKARQGQKAARGCQVLGGRRSSN